MADPAENNMASFDSPVYEHNDDIGSPDTTENQPQQMDSDDLNVTSTSTHSDASTLPKDSPELNGVDNNQNTDDFDDDDEHEYTYPDGLTGGTFDAPAPTSALINAPNTENVMLTEVVIPDNRHTESLPDYYNSGPSKTKPYKFYGKFHSTYRICKILGFIFLALTLVATCTVLVLRVSVDHEIFDDEEESTVPVVVVTEMTYRFSSSIAVTEIGGEPIVFSEALNDKESDEYGRVADEVQNSMDAIYRTGDLSDAYERSVVTNIRYGSVIVDVDLIFKSRITITSNKVETEIQNELTRNSNVIGEIMIDPESVSVTDYGAQLSTGNPSVKPVTDVLPTASSTVVPVIDCAEDEILCSNTTCISIERLCNGSYYNCLTNSEQHGCSTGVNSTCAEELELLLKVSAYYNETIFWHFSCLDDGSWDPLQCIPSENECFCVDKYGSDIPESYSTYDNKPNCTEAVSTTPPPVLGRSACPEIRCKNGACVGYFQISDGIDDCGDNSDEKFEDCGPNPFFCAEGLCIHSDFVCDGEIDCTSNTLDEDDCE